MTEVPRRVITEFCETVGFDPVSVRRMVVTGKRIEIELYLDDASSSEVCERAYRSGGRVSIPVRDAVTAVEVVEVTG